VRAMPREVLRDLPPAQVFHEVLEHRWYLSEQAGASVPLDEATRSYIQLKTNPELAAAPS
jgi:hypothetical protein